MARYGWRIPHGPVVYWANAYLMRGLTRKHTGPDHPTKLPANSAINAREFHQPVGMVG